MSDHPPPVAAPPPRAPSIMNRIVASSLGQPLLVIVFTMLLLGTGIRSLNRLPVDAYPDLSPPMVEITTQWPGHAAEEVERLVTVPIETEMNGTPGIHVLRSISFFGHAASFTLGKAGRIGVSNAQCFSYFAPWSIQ